MQRIKSVKQIRKEGEFKDILNDLFHIAHADAEKIIKIKKDHEYLRLQRLKRRPGHMTLLNTKFMQLEKRRTERARIENVKRRKVEELKKQFGKC